MLDGPSISRRCRLRIGGLGYVGLNLAGLFRAEATASVSAERQASGGKLKSCIVIFYYGGPSHLDTWDMKPEAPREVRGEFATVATTVPGVRISEHLLRSARVLHKLAIVRSMHHRMRNHNSAAAEALCGRTPPKGDLELLADDPDSFPCYGAALSYLKPGNPAVPQHVALPHVMYNVVMLPGQTAGFLGAAYQPFHVTGDPNGPDFRVAELQLPADLSLARLEDRRSLLSVIDAQLHGAARLAETGAMSTFQERAFDVLRSETVRRAFDLGQETASARERYGRNKLGQSLLLARRLVEAGVRFVNVNDKVVNAQTENWDSHEKIFPRLKDDLLPPADQAFSALVEDLDERGLLDSTLVVSLGEFGRTPWINKSGGRDHWPDCFSVVLSGGGVVGGSSYGTSDKLGAYPASNPVTPGDLAATVFWRFGLDPAAELHDRVNRPHRLADGQPLTTLFG